MTSVKLNKDIKISISLTVIFLKKKSKTRRLLGDDTIVLSIQDLAISPDGFSIIIKSNNIDNIDFS
jgi:hypothetical protein